MACRMAGVPAILSRRVDNRESNSMAKLRYSWFEKVVAISENVADVLSEQGFDSDKLSVIRSAVDATAMAPAPDRRVLADRFGIVADDCAIAVVSQLIRRKGHRFLLDVLPGLAEQHPGVRVVFFGEGSAEHELKALSTRLGLGGVVRFAGFRRDLDTYLGAFDMLVHPAEREGLGVAMLKAAAAGLPVVAFDTGGATEAVVHAKTGVLVEPGNLDLLQKAIGALIEDSALRADFGRAGRERMQKNFSIETMVESHIELYERVLGG
jgi:glycosyltransferase involved in cell wall biosynthesis